ncbi:MAG: hypothetical protein FJ319_02655 [SAR202 cluster bacterium]|nr:hypothetical protein [SAR202 cluster bacterium]
MNRFALPLLVWALVVSVMFPSIGPLVDHHFAERQLGHIHLGHTTYHVHYADLAHSHDHSHGDGGHEQQPQSATTLYSYESGALGSIVSITEDLGLASFLLFDPASIFTLPGNGSLNLVPVYLSPPDDPPRA